MFLEQEEHLIDSMYHCCREESKKNNSETSHPSIEKRFADEKLGREEKFARTETKKSGSQRNARSIEGGGGKERFTISRN